MKTLTRAVLLSAILLTLNDAAHAQDKQPPTPAPSGFALEISIEGHRPAYQSVPGESFGGLYGRVPGAPLPPGAAGPLTIRVTDQMEGDAVRVVVSAYTDKFHDREIAIASYLLREGERATVNEMRNVGFEPFGLAVVRVKPDAPAPPTAASKVASVGVVGVEARRTNFPSFKVTLRNLSQKDIVYLEVRSFAEGGRPMNVLWPRGEQNRALIPAGGVYDVNVSGGSLGGKAADGYTPNSPRSVEVVAAVFSDYTYEGDAGSAATHLARLHGQRAQLARVVALLREAAAGANERAASDNLKARASALGRELDEAAREEARARFAELGLAEPPSLKSSYEYGLNLVRKELLTDIEEFGRAQSKPFAQWVSELTRKYEAWLSRV